MLCIVKLPIEIMLVQGSGYGSFASVAKLIAVDIGVGSNLTLLTAKATVPVAIFFGFPAATIQMLVQGLGDRSLTDVA